MPGFLQHVQGTQNRNSLLYRKIDKTVEMYKKKLLKNTYHWRIRGRGPGGPLPLIFRLNWGPKGRKKFVFDTYPALSQSLDDRPPSQLI